KVVEGMGYTNSRIQVVDRTSRVLLSVGDIQTATGLARARDEPDVSSNPYWRFIEEKILHPAHYQVLTQPSTHFLDERYVGSRLEGAHISSARTGEAMTEFRTINDNQTRILEAAYPIYADGEIMGAVVVEQNMNGLRTFRNQALET